jgi:sec-independent protein translocase protein TatA
MGPLGVPEMIVIFILALVLFGPKKLPELGRTLGKAITEFRRATSDLKSTFEREMQSLEREGESLREVTHAAASDIHSHTSYEYPYHDSGYGTDSYNADPYHDDSTAHQPSTLGASAVPGAESHGTTEAATSTTTAVEAAPHVEGTVPRTDSHSVTEAAPHAGATPEHSQHS